MQHLRAVLFASVAAAASSGCASTSVADDFIGTYAVKVSASGKTDSTFVVVDPGADGDLLLHFTHGFSTDLGAPNGTGLRGDISGGELELKSQRVHVDHATGTLDGMLTGIGSSAGDRISITLKVLPENAIVKDRNGQPLPAGTTVDYEVDGPRQ